MERAIESFVAVTAVIVGLSHILQARAWIEFNGVLSRMGRSAFFSGEIRLVPGAVIVAGHGAWSWPGAPITVLGWLLEAKGATSLLAPPLALRSMERASSRAGFVVGGAVLLAVGAWAGFCAWQRGGGT